MCAPDLQYCIAAIASLDEPVRRELYLYVAGRGGEVGRDEAARALRISRALAAFHLDKLVALGLLDAAYRRLSGRQGPGAGRPAKLYRRSTRQLEITLPQRRYDLAGRLLARALAAQRSPASPTPPSPLRTSTPSFRQPPGSRLLRHRNRPRKARF